VRDDVEYGDGKVEREAKKRLYTCTHPPIAPRPQLEVISRRAIQGIHDILPKRARKLVKDLKHVVDDVQFNDLLAADVVVDTRDLDVTHDGRGAYDESALDKVITVRLRENGGLLCWMLHAAKQAARRCPQSCNAADGQESKMKEKEVGAEEVAKRQERLQRERDTQEIHDML